MVIGKCTDVFRRFFFLDREGIEERGSRGRIFPWRNLLWGERISIKGAQDFLILFKTKKNNEKINVKKFFQLKVRSSIKTKRTEITAHMRGSSLPEYLLFTLKYF